MSFLYSTTLRYFTIGFLFSPLVLTVFFLFSFTLREIGHTSSSMVSSICLGIISTELLLFVSFFWGVFSSILSPSYATDSTTLTTEGLISISSRSLIVTITFLLSTASVILGYGILTSEKALNLSVPKGFIALVIVALSFTSIQVCEYLGLAVYINDGSMGTYLFSLTGLHFFHVLIGAILLFFNFWKGSLQYNPNTQTRTYNGSSYIVLPQLESYTLLYWHFVEIIWLVIHSTFYTL